MLLPAGRAMLAGNGRRSRPGAAEEWGLPATADATGFPIGERPGSGAGRCHGDRFWRTRWRGRIVQRRRRMLWNRRLVRIRWQACRDPVGRPAAHRPYTEGIRQGLATM